MRRASDTSRFIGSTIQEARIDVSPAQGSFQNTGADETDHARRVQVVELRRRPLSRAGGNRDKPHLCAGLTLK
jgi:hypothetical protein